MGTRGMNMIVVDGEFKCAQYNQFDSYTNGQGLTALKFLRDEMKFEQFKQKVLQSSWISEEEHKQLWIEAGAEPDSDMVDLDVSKKFKEKNLHLHRDCGANIYALIQNSANGLKLQNDIEFAADSLFCEWLYVVDMDKNTFEVYKGFNEKPLKKNERFHFLQKSGQYYPVKLVKTYSLSSLPSDEDFKQDFAKKEDE